MGIREPLLICGALKSLLNVRLLFTFTFEIHNHTYSVYTMERQYLPPFTRIDVCQWCSGSVNHQSSLLTLFMWEVIFDVL